MSKVFITVFLIFGTIVGSGFSSGNEIMIFFSRFGVLSYFYIILAGILLFFLFYFFLLNGNKIANHIENSKWLNGVIAGISIVFCASMFAGMTTLFEYFPKWMSCLLNVMLLLICFLTSIKGVKGLEKINLILMPVTTIVFLVVLIFGSFRSSEINLMTNSWAGILYGFLYVALNTSMSGVILAKVGEGMSKKQVFYSSFFATVLIVFFLMFGNYVLLNNMDSFSNEMPYLFISSENPIVFVMSFVVILVGCFTTLISLCITLKTAYQKRFKSEMKACVFAVFVPYIISNFGFSQIVEFLYPICSVIGVAILLYIIINQLTPKR